VEETNVLVEAPTATVAEETARGAEETATAEETADETTETYLEAEETAEDYSVALATTHLRDPNAASQGEICLTLLQKLAKQ
jgi:hypothetical protein